MEKMILMMTSTPSPGGRVQPAGVARTARAGQCSLQQGGGGLSMKL